MAEPRRKVSARQRNKRGTPGDEEEWYMYGDEYGGFEADVDEPPPPPPEGKWGLGCLVCGGGGEVACCEVRLRDYWVVWSGVDNSLDL